MPFVIKLMFLVWEDVQNGCALIFMASTCTVLQFVQLQQF